MAEPSCIWMLLDTGRFAARFLLLTKLDVVAADVPHVLFLPQCSRGWVFPRRRTVDCRLSRFDVTIGEADIGDSVVPEVDVGELLRRSGEIPVFAEFLKRCHERQVRGV